jgi:hypothetical protein
MSRRAPSGQAAVEGIGIAVTIALALAAVSAWLLSEVRPPSRPPAFVEAVSAPLVRDPAPFENLYPLPRPAFTLPRGRDDEPIGRALRALGRGTRDGLVLVAEMRQEFAVAYAERLRERGERFLHDPLGGLAALPDPALLTPEGAVGQGLEDAARLWAYAEELRSMPARRAALRASADAGALAADLTIEAAQSAAGKRIGRIGRDRGSREP